MTLNPWQRKAQERFPGRIEESPRVIGHRGRDTEGVTSMRADTTARFWAKVRKGDVCWTWQAGGTPYGYGSFWDGERQVMAHRHVYEMLVGPIPEGMHIDHLCRNPHCVNPDHLEPVAPGENVRRGFGRTALNARKTRCSRGHEFTSENTRIGVKGRVCRQCNREHQMALRKSRREAVS